MKLNAAFLKAKQMLVIDKTKVKENRQAASLMMSMLCVLAIFLPEMAQASPWDNAAEWVLNILQGGLARTIAIICVIACGIAAWMGKLSMDWLVKIVVGLALVFGAAAIVDAVMGAVGG
jgi:type IV secretory pathway VirB2 component (pilin)